MVSVAIIGGGISGLAAAYRLRQQNVAVTLFEATERVGGVIRSERCAGYLVEHGPSSVEGSDPITQELIHDLGLDGQRITACQPTRKLAIVRNGKALALPVSAKAFVASPLFSPLGKLRLLREPFVKAGDPQQEESVAAFARRRLGQEGCDYLISTFVTSVLAGDPERFSIRHALSGLSQSEQRYGSLTRGLLLASLAKKKSAQQVSQNASQGLRGNGQGQQRQVASASSGVQAERARAFSFRQGLQTLTDAFFTQIQPYVRLHTPVICLRRNASGWTVTTKREEREEHIDFDAVIYTAPLYQISSMKIEPACDSTSLSEVEYPPLSLLALGFRREQVGHHLAGTAMFVPLVEGRTLRATLFSSSVYPERAPEGHVLLTNFIGGSCNPAHAQLPTEELLATLLRELRPLLGITGSPAFSRHIYLSHSLPQYNVGYGRVLACIERMEARLPGFFMAGNYRQGVSVRGALLSGYETASRVLALLAPALAL